MKAYNSKLNKSSLNKIHNYNTIFTIFKQLSLHTNNITSNKGLIFIQLKNFVRKTGRNILKDDLFKDKSKRQNSNSNNNMNNSSKPSNEDDTFQTFTYSDNPDEDPNSFDDIFDENDEMFYKNLNNNRKFSQGKDIDFDTLTREDLLKNSIETTVVKVKKEKKKSRDRKWKLTEEELEEKNKNEGDGYEYQNYKFEADNEFHNVDEDFESYLKQDNEYRRNKHEEKKYYENLKHKNNDEDKEVKENFSDDDYDDIFKIDEKSYNNTSNAYNSSNKGYIDIKPHNDTDSNNNDNNAVSNIENNKDIFQLERDELMKGRKTKRIKPQLNTKLSEDVLKDFLGEVDQINDRLKTNKELFNKTFTGRIDPDKLHSEENVEEYIDDEEDNLEGKSFLSKLKSKAKKIRSSAKATITEVTEFLVKKPSKNFKWGVTSEDTERNELMEQKGLIFVQGEKPSYLQLVKYAELCRLKDIKVIPTLELGFSHLSKYSILTTGFNSKHIHKCAKDLLKELKSLKIEGRMPTISGRRHEEMMIIESGECTIYFFTENGREQHDLEFKWLNAKSMTEMAKKDNHYMNSELYSKKRKYKF